MSDIKKVGVIGWGRMGAEMGRWLIGADWSVTALDPSATARAAAREAGADIADSVTEIGASSDLILVIVVDDEQVNTIVAGPEGLLASARPGTVIAVCSSVRPDTCAKLAETAAEQGVSVIDVALVGGERAAEQAGLTLMCGGDADAMDRAGAPFSSFAINVIHVGGPGAGQVAKSANNVLMWSAIRIDVEVLRLSKTLGVEPSKMRSILNAGTGGNRVLTDWGLHRLRWPAKDLEVALALAEEAGVDVPYVRALQPLMAELSVADLEALR
ncbi:NAD(P)-dependent oxidoreductase [Streptomyces sp. NPDC052077]|uniref:NAD(P)-dependent oxidoreductase n=1 Tax=Streptomyces sp. NPDC052077 TaxID=3154757 RepID=UPI003430116F